MLTKHETRRRLIRGHNDVDLLARHAADWLVSAQGRSLLDAEQALLNPVIERLFGYQILQIGCSDSHSLIEGSTIRQKIRFSRDPSNRTLPAIADTEELPLATDSVDVILLHHSLDFANDSHSQLREATRVLRPGGKLLVVGFNPLSCWGLTRLFKRKASVPWCGRFISRHRMADWLQLLDLHIDQVDTCVHYLPVRSSRLLKTVSTWETLGLRLRSPFGAVYIFQCIKQVAPITPIMPRWRPIRARTTSIPAAENVRIKVH